MERATFVLAVVGEFSSGKSFLLNALLGQFRFEQIAGHEQIAGLLATDINPSTAAITELEYSAQTEAHAYHADGRVERVPIEGLTRFVAASAEADAPARVVVRVDSEFLRRGFSLADTPGLASIDPAHRRATLQFLPSADAVLYLIDTQQPFTEGDASFLGIVRQHLDTIFIVQTKIDLWEMQTHNGKTAWEAARDRIVQLAAVHAPGTFVYPVSARQYIEATLRADASLLARSHFPQFLHALDTSLVRNTGRARLTRAAERARVLAEDEVRRLERDREMLGLSLPDLQALQSRVRPHLSQLEAFVEAQRAQTLERFTRMVQAIGERSATLAEETQDALTRAFDAADVSRLRDRARLHMLVDRTLGEVVEVFAAEIASAVRRELETAARAAAQRLTMRFSFAAAASGAFESSSTGKLWDEDPAQALCATIVLGALGGPAISLVEAIASRFRTAAAGTYMKRELTADLRSTIWPAFRVDMQTFARDVAGRLAAIGTAYADALDEALARERELAAGSIERALRAHERGRSLESQKTVLEQRARDIDTVIDAVDRDLRGFLHRESDTQICDTGEEAVRRSHVEAAFDREAYRLGLRPQRWRVTILGALRRGKSSLINAFAGRRVLGDEVAGAIAYPVHVRYGEHEAAFALQSDGEWREIEVEAALEEAARNPVLILTPWQLPRQLVLVHAPAFDAGESALEDVCVVAAREASEVLCLFSRQLSDRELALYQRIADLGKPMMFVHTLADNESASERRHVVELARRYLAERNIPAQRLFTVSTLEYAQARREHRAAAGWNEFDALASTIAAHAEEHMARLERLERAAAAASTVPPRDPAPVQHKRGILARLFSR